MADRITLLNEKKDVFANILSLTRSFAITGEDSDVDEYSALMARRRGYTNRAKAIDEILSKAPAAGRRGEDADEEALSREIAETVRAIIALDGEITAKIPGVMDMIKKRLKGISASKNISNSYNYGENKGSGLLFDTRK